MYKTKVFFYSFYNDVLLTKDIEFPFVPSKYMVLIGAKAGQPLTIDRVQYLIPIKKFTVIIKNRFKYSEEKLEKLVKDGWQLTKLRRVVEDELLPVQKLKE